LLRPDVNRDTDKVKAKLTQLYEYSEERWS
jgi:hypothetical protein